MSLRLVRDDLGNYKTPTPSTSTREWGVCLPSSFWQRSDLSLAAKSLYAILCTYQRGNDRCWPSHETLCAHASISHPTLIAHLNELSDAGLLSIERRAHGRGNVYSLTEVKNLYLTDEPSDDGLDARSKNSLPHEPGERKNLYLTTDLSERIFRRRKTHSLKKNESSLKKDEEAPAQEGAPAMMHETDGPQTEPDAHEPPNITTALLDTVCTALADAHTTPRILEPRERKIVATILAKRPEVDHDTEASACALYWHTSRKVVKSPALAYKSWVDRIGNHPHAGKTQKLDMSRPCPERPELDYDPETREAAARSWAHFVKTRDAKRAAAEQHDG